MGKTTFPVYLGVIKGGEGMPKAVRLDIDDPDVRNFFEQLRKNGRLKVSECELVVREQLAGYIATLDLKPHNHWVSSVWRIITSGFSPLETVPWGERRALIRESFLNTDFSALKLTNLGPQRKSVLVGFQEVIRKQTV